MNQMVRVMSTSMGKRMHKVRGQNGHGDQRRHIGGDGGEAPVIVGCAVDVREVCKGSWGVVVSVVGRTVT